MTKFSSELFCEIEKICEGLIYISETDAPVRAFVGQTVDHATSNIILQQIIKATDVAVEEKDFDYFFERLSANRDWHGEAETARANKFGELKKLLEENLSRRCRGRESIFQIGVKNRLGNNQA